MNADSPTIDVESPPLRVVNGVILVGKTRVPLDTVIECHLEGQTPEQIIEAYDAIPLSDAYAAIAYYLRHREDVDAYMRHRREESERLRQEITSDPEYKRRVESLIQRGREKGLRP